MGHKQNWSIDTLISNSNYIHHIFASKRLLLQEKAVVGSQSNRNASHTQLFSSFAYAAVSPPISTWQQKITPCSNLIH
jgi:hypothetical protein